MKTKLGAVNCLYPMPTVLVGANVKGKPNFLTIAHLGIMDFLTVSVSLGKIHHTNKGIVENKTFSINIPSMNLLKETDYCGIVSGADEDKSKLFDVFYGTLGTAPLIKECPVCIECRLVKKLDFPKHDIFVGEIVETHANREVLTDGILDFGKIDPLLFVMNDRNYWSLGKPVAKCWNVGRELKKEG